MLQDLTGHVVAVTGAGTGIGEAVATAVARRGALVAIGDIDYDSAQRSASAINHSVTPDGGGMAIALGLDVRERESFRRFLEETRGDLGPIDVLINYAGTRLRGPLLEESDESAKRAFDVNVGGSLNGMKLALPAMVERRSGQVMNVAGFSGLVPAPGRATHGATNSAVIALTRSAQSEFRGTGVTLTAVVPRSRDPERVARGIVRAIGSRARTVFVPSRARAVSAFRGVVPRRWARSPRLGSGSVPPQ